MLRVLTDEESIAHADELIERIARSITSTCLLHPGASIDALCQVLWMVNGQNWISVSDMARAKVRAKALGAREARGDGE